MVANISMNPLTIVSCEHHGFFDRAASRSEYGVEREPVQQASQIQRVGAGCHQPNLQGLTPASGHPLCINDDQRIALQHQPSCHGDSPNPHIHDP